MTKKSSTPAIRFKGFTDTWEQRKLGELAVFNPKEEIPDVFEYVDLESVVGTEMLSHRTEEKATAPSRAQRLAHTGDLFYQTVRPYQKNNYLFEKPDKHYVFSTGYAQLRPFIDGYFLLGLVQNGQFVKTVLDNCTGTSYPAINANDLAEIEVFSPKDEQEHHQIGTYFRNLDNLITLHQRKYDKLTNVKKSMLEKMFPKNGSSVPEIRFKGFSDAWEQRELWELTIWDKKFNEVEAEKQPKIIKYPYVLADVFSKIEDASGDVRLLSTGNYIGYTTDEKAGKNLCVGEVVAIPWGGVPNIKYYKGKFVTADNRIATSNDTETLGNRFLSLYLEHNLAFLQSIYRGASIKHPSMNDVLSMQISIPHIQEQREIENWFANLDNLITLHQRELEKLKNLKKACLEKMFV